MIAWPTLMRFRCYNASEIKVMWCDQQELRNELFFDGKAYLEKYPVQITSVYENTFLPYDASEDV